MTKFAPHKALKLIEWGKLTFDERVVLHRVDGGAAASGEWFRAGAHYRLDGYPHA